MPVIALRFKYSYNETIGITVEKLDRIRPYFIGLMYKRYNVYTYRKSIDTINDCGEYAK